jgi:predicted MFS family arabinose efflux permease
VGLGAFISGWVYENDSENFRAVFFTGAAVALAGFLYLKFLVPEKAFK